MAEEAIQLAPDPIPLRPEAEPERSTSFVGMVIFLGSWAILFAGLFAVFGAFRFKQPVWPPEGVRLPLLIPALNTGIIAASSALLFRAERLLRADKPLLFRRWLAAAVALGVLFLAAQVGMWIDLWTTGLTIRAHLYASFFWTLTVFHGLHVLAGLVVLAWLLPQARQAATPRRAVRVKVAAMFWHFVGVIWLLTFALLFLS